MIINQYIEACLKNQQHMVYVITMHDTYDPKIKLKNKTNMDRQTCLISSHHHHDISHTSVVIPQAFQI